MTCRSLCALEELHCASLHRHLSQSTLCFLSPLHKYGFAGLLYTKAGGKAMCLPITLSQKAGGLVGGETYLCHFLFMKLFPKPPSKAHPSEASLPLISPLVNLIFS